MEMTIGSLELNRTNPAHLGTKPLGITDGFSKKGTEAVSSKKDSFENYLLDAVEKLNGQQTDVDKLEEKLITDPDSVDIHDVTIAMAKAQMSLTLAQTVVDRVITGWTNLSQTR
ncbi:MAG: flagellar hook-basal body complex protein FliE [Treponema sp.]|nr:flagellar hook-basal body complex protein FliE [Treponema sp.]